MIVGVDFDGTLACWPRNCRPNYQEVDWSVAVSAAQIPVISFVREAHDQGHVIVVVTGRGVDHRRHLQFWCKTALGFDVNVICRPRTVGLSCPAQAAWKQEILARLGAKVYIGDRKDIDQVAAVGANARYVSVNGISLSYLACKIWLN